MAEILKSFYNTGIRPAVYYYRDKDQKEVDLLIVQNGRMYPLEIKKTASPGKDDLKNFAARVFDQGVNGTGRAYLYRRLWDS
ncbi:MAG: DUF4143 domain-containing protein [Treponema sp.]|nr:DUF4143 domain-containing protein [Treponema sp.]